MPFFHLLKDKLIDRLEEKIATFIELKSADFFEDKTYLSIDRYIELNQESFLLNIGYSPDDFFKEYADHVNNILDNFELACLELTLFKEYHLLSLIDRNDAFEVLEFSKLTIDTVKHNIQHLLFTQALEIIQILYLESNSEKEEIH